MNNTPEIKANTIGAIAKQYGMDTRTLKDMIKLHPELNEQAALYFDSGKILLPPKIIEGIYQALGNP